MRSARGQRLIKLYAAALLAAACDAIFDRAARPNVFLGFGPLDFSVYAFSLGLFAVTLRYLFEAMALRASKVAWWGVGALGTLVAMAVIQDDFSSQFGIAFGPSSAVTSVTPWPSFEPFLARVPKRLATAIPFAVTLAVLAIVVRRRTRTPTRYAATTVVRPLLIAVSAMVLALVSTRRASLWSRDTMRLQQAMPRAALYVGGIGVQIGLRSWRTSKSFPHGRTSPELPPLRFTRARNVIFLVTESVRASSYGNEASHSEGARRVSMKRMRALASTTAISTFVLWSGYPVTASSQEAHSVPLLWEYAHAGGYATGYYSAQTLLFANNGHWLDGLPLDRHVSATLMDPFGEMRVGADDERVLDQTANEVGTLLPEPFLAVTHLSNTHFPYKTAPNERDYPPEGSLDGVAAQERYERSVALQKMRIAGFMKKLRNTSAGARTVVVFVSDHGEQFYEHGFFSHTHSLYDEDVLVPAWIDAPTDLLSNDEWSSLEQNAAGSLTHADVLPTLLGLLGIQSPKEFEKGFVGRNLLLPALGAEPVHLASNCTSWLACDTPSFSVVSGSHKLIGNEKKRDCFDLDVDPSERSPRAPNECAPLVDAFDRLRAGAHLARR